MDTNYKYEIAEIQKGLKELELREQHPLRIYRPTDQQLPVHESGSSEVLTIGGRRSGKTLAVVMEFASRILGIPITRQDGTEIPLRFRAPSRKNPGLYWVIGLNVDHIGQTIYHRLFSEGLGAGANFRIIQDLATGKWRSYNPNTDRERYRESRLSPPIFGEHMIEPNSWHMESAAGNVFKSVRLICGAHLYAYPSTGDSPKKGDAVDGIWIDEDIERGAFLGEWQDRLITNRGWFLWSVWPQVANQALIKTLERAKREAENPKHPIQMFRLIGSDNPFSDREGIAEGLARMENDDDVAHRDRGDIDAFLSGRRMYDFGSVLHVPKPQEHKEPANAIQVIANLLHENPQLPLEWTRYLVIDPSHTCTACLFGVVPPPEWKGVEMGQRIIIEREFVVKMHTPAMFAEGLRPHVEGLRFEAFVMDQMAGRQTTIGADTTVFQAYEDQFKRNGIQSRVSRYGFLRGSNDKATRRRAVRDLLEPTEGGWPRLLITNRCGLTIRQMYEFRKKVIKDQDGYDIPTDDGVNEKIYDCVMAIEYLGQYINDRFRDGTAYVAPAEYRSNGSQAYFSAQALIAQMNKEAGGAYVHLGPGAAA